MEADKQQDGKVWQPAYTTKSGKVVPGHWLAKRGSGRIWQMGNIWWIQYYSRGRRIQESSKSENRKDAEKLLKLRHAEVLMGNHPKLRRLKYEDLRDAYYADYTTNRRKSLRFSKDGKPNLDKVSRLDKFFEGYRAADVDTDLMREFTKKLQGEGYPASTINRSLSALRRMFNLAEEDGKIRYVPHFPMLKEPPPRKGFFEHSEYLALFDSLPDYLRPVLALGYHTGMRSAEILGLKWEQVDFFDKMIRLNAGETKNDQARAIPIAGELETVLRSQHTRRRLGCEFVCFRLDQDGNAIRLGDFRKVWQSRCVKLGFGKMIEATEATTGKPLFDRPRGPHSKPKVKMRYEGRLFHDLRRTQVRNLVRAAVPERVAMAITGHKTRSVFDRYNIVSGRDIEAAGQSLGKYLAEQIQDKVGSNSGEIQPAVTQQPQLVQ